jgi:hypothetical protein
MKIIQFASTSKLFIGLDDLGGLWWSERIVYTGADEQEQTASITWRPVHQTFLYEPTSVASNT